MLVLILPGFSVHNKGWVDEIDKEISSCVPVYWKHWLKRGRNVLSVTAKPKNFIDLVNQTKFNIIAKSVGTGVALKIAGYSPTLINKIILCGIPSMNLMNKIDEYAKVYSQFKKGQVVCFQNEADPLGHYDKIVSVLGESVPNIKFIKGHRSDHSYPFYDEFKRFLR